MTQHKDQTESYDHDTITKPISHKERSATMQARLIEATLTALSKHGYHGASLSVILKEAGVSRGAWSHHFKSKKELVAKAAESILQHAIGEAKKAATNLKAAGNVTSILDFIWNNFYTGRHRDVWLEFNNAARTDHELKERLMPILEEFHSSLDQIWLDNLRTDDTANGKMLMNLTIYFLRGLAIQSVSYDKPDYYAKLRNDWAALIEPHIRWK